MKRLLLILGIMGCLLFSAAALAEPAIAFTPADPKVGEYVDVVVTPGREGAQSVAYTLETEDGVVFSGEADTHFTASFRPRTEKAHLLKVTVSYGKKDTETAEITIPVSGALPEQAGADIVYSQKDGWWKDKVYSAKHKRSLQKAGCAIFALSHALQRLGHSGAAVMPDTLGTQYTKCYIEERGTDNERLLTLAGEQFGFLTEPELIETEKELAIGLRRGDLFSFSIVIGHIALADGLSEDGAKVHIVDSAPGATWERLKNGAIYLQDEDGTFTAIQSLEEIPGLRYFFETQEYGGMTYWMDLSYCAKRGMRLIRRPWLTLADEAEGADDPARPLPRLEQTGTLQCVVRRGEEDPRTVLTKDLRWTVLSREGGQDVFSDGPSLAIVTKKGGASFTDGDGNKLSGFKAIPEGALLPVLSVDKDSVYIFYRNTWGFVSRKSVDLLAAGEGEFRTGLISVNGKTRGTATVKIRATASAKGRGIADWKIGTKVAIVQQSKDFFLVEGNGQRGWVSEKNLTVEAAGD